MEIDCLIEEKNKLLAIEIKSGKTFSEDMKNNLKHWQQISKSSAEKRELSLIYAGSQESSFKGIKLVPWKKVAEL